MNNTFETTFDDSFFGKYLGRKIYNYILSKKLTLLKLEKITGMKQPHMSTLLNGKRVTKNLEQYKRIAKGAGMTEKEFENLVIEARKAEFTHSLGKDIQEGQIEDFGGMLSREFGINNEEAIKDIKRYINYIKNNQ